MVSLLTTIKFVSYHQSLLYHWSHSCDTDMLSSISIMTIINVIISSFLKVCFLFVDIMHFYHFYMVLIFNSTVKFYSYITGLLESSCPLKTLISIQVVLEQIALILWLSFICVGAGKFW